MPDDNVGYTVEQTGCQHDGTDDTNANADDVGVKVD